jgi:poly(3-hydroxybutyrate) depolymerase
VLFSEPIPDQFAQFAEAMGCDPEGERVQTSTDISPRPTATATTACRSCSTRSSGGGHAWPSSPLAEPDSPMVEQLTELQGYTTFDIDATADSWAFFEQHTLAAD